MFISSKVIYNHQHVWLSSLLPALVTKRHLVTNVNDGADHYHMLNCISRSMMISEFKVTLANAVLFFIGSGEILHSRDVNVSRDSVTFAFSIVTLKIKT